MDKTFIRVLPFYTQPIVGDPELEIPMPVALWRCGENVCEGRTDTSPCDDSEGLYYTVAGDEVTYWCPRHWYELHSGVHPGQRLIAMPAEQHRQESAAHRDRLFKAWHEAEEHVEHAARWLQQHGLAEQAGKLHHARGAIRASIQAL